MSEVWRYKVESEFRGDKLGRDGLVLAEPGRTGLGGREQSPVEERGIRCWGRAGGHEELEPSGWEFELAFSRRRRWAGLGRIRE